MQRLEIYIDGASKGNPGNAGIGVIICRDGEVLKNISSYIGKATNNVAEYTALIYALEEGLLIKATHLNIKTDSQLLYRQVRKEYKVKHPNIIGLYERVMQLISGFQNVQIEHISREQNRGADKLATKAVTAHLKKENMRSG